jgi:hypothetical protein
MKKSARRLHLHRETLQTLGRSLADADGAASTTPTVCANALCQSMPWTMCWQRECL